MNRKQREEQELEKAWDDGTFIQVWKRQILEERERRSRMEVIKIIACILLTTAMLAVLINQIT